MANPKRKMATMRRIDSITAIQGADRIEAIHIGGWTVVDRKGVYHEGQLVVYMEPDTALPTDNEHYAFLKDRGERDMLFDGRPRKVHVLRTVRFRGVYSQGIIFDPHDLLPESIPDYAYEKMCQNKVDLSKMCGVREYENPNAMMGWMRAIRRYDDFVGPRTDAERIQNVSERVYGIVRRTEHFASVKVDGTSITMVNDPRYGKVRVFSHNNELDTEDGFGKRVLEQSKAQGIHRFLTDNPGITLQMEACGTKINGNRLGINGLRLFVFSAWEMQRQTYLSPYRIFWDFADPELRQSLTPRVLIDLDEYPTTQDLIEHVDGMRSSVVRDRLDEGLVIHVIGRGDVTQGEWDALESELGPTMQVKVISRAYLAKAKE